MTTGCRDDRRREIPRVERGRETSTGDLGRDALAAWQIVVGKQTATISSQNSSLDGWNCSWLAYAEDGWTCSFKSHVTLAKTLSKHLPSCSQYTAEGSVPRWDYSVCFPFLLGYARWKMDGHCYAPQTSAQGKRALESWMCITEPQGIRGICLSKVAGISGGRKTHTRGRIWTMGSCSNACIHVP